MSYYQQVSVIEARLNKDGDSGGSDLETQCKVYKTRWLMLFLFAIFSISSIMHIMHYAIIADVTVKYYEVTYTAVNWSFTVYLLCYMVVGFPAAFFLDKWGLRKTVVFGMGVTCAGAWIKVASVSPDRYWVALLGQILIAISQVAILPVPPKLAAIWFPANEVSLACSIGVVGINMGLAVGFLVPPLFFHFGSSEADISTMFYLLCISFSIVDTVIFVIILIFFRERPPTPPSIAQLQKAEHTRYFNSIKLFINNRTNIFLTVAYGITIGLLLAVSTLLNQIVLNHYPNAHNDAGLIGLVMILAGSVGSIVSGVVLDRYGKFKQTTLLLSLLGIASMLSYTFAISKGIAFVYLISAAFGFSTLGMQSAGLELGAEIAYPLPEGLIAGVLTTSTQVFGIAFTYLYSYILETEGDYYANLTMFGIFVIQFICMCCIKYDLRRRAVESVKIIR